MLRGEAQSPGCEACPFAKDGKPVNPVAGEGSDSPSFLIVGEGPGKTERQTGRPFIGESGKMLDRALRSAGADRANVWITNAMCCTPEGATDAKKEQARRCCLPRLESELLHFPKAPILTLGAVAARPFLDGSIYDYAGTVHTWLGRPAIPTIHPAAILRGGAGAADEQGTDGLFFNLIYDTSKVHQLASGKIRPFTIDVETGIGDKDQVERLVLDFCTEAKAAKLVGVDLETTSLKTSQAQIRSIGLATVRRSVSVWWDDLGIVALAALHDLLGDEAIVKVFHNRLYDVPILIRYGFPVAGKIHCTLILHANVFFGLPHNLQRVASQIMLIPPWKAEFRVQARPTIWAKLHNRVASFEKLGVLGVLGAIFACAFWIKELLRYNAIDALATVRVLGPLLAMGEKAQVIRCYEADLHDAHVATEIMVEGIPVDVEVNERLGKQFKAEIVRSNDLLQEWATDPAIFEAFKDRLAMELAKAYCRAAVWTKPKKMAPKLKRAADPTDFISRHAVRMVEIPIDLAKAGARYIRARMKGHEDLPRTGLHALGVVGVICAATRRWFRPGSARFHVVAFLKAKKAPLVVETQSGGYSTERKILEGLRWHPNVAALLEFREAQKMLSTFIVKVRENVELDSRVRPRISLPKTSGRWGFEAPMMQNWPQANERKKRPNLRQQVVAPEGFEIVGFDFDKQEARGVAFLSGDQLLCEYLQPGRDLWTEMSRLVWPDFDKLAKEERKVLRNFIKRPGYGSLYKGSVDTLWQNLLKDDPAVKREDVARVVTILQTRLVGVNAWHEELFRQVAKPPHQLREHLLGRLWTWPLGRYSPNDITNYPVQALGASLMKLGLRRIYEGGLPAGAQALLHVHDAFYWVVPKSSVAEMKEKINSSFTQTHVNPAKGITMIFPVEAKSGHSLAEL